MKIKCTVLTSIDYIFIFYNLWFISDKVSLWSAETKMQHGEPCKLADMMFVPLILNSGSWEEYAESKSRQFELLCLTEVQKTPVP